MLRIDHVLLAVRDLDQAGADLERTYGLGSVPGGRHAGHGTANRIVPLGPASYLELIAVVDPDEASTSVLGQRVAAAAANSFFGWCVATDDIEATATRLGRPVLAMGRPRADGTALAWRLTGLEDTAADPSLPFFITWDVDPSLHPSTESVTHRVEPLGIATITVAADPAVLETRLGLGHGLPVEVVRHGPPGVRAVTITTREDSVTVEAGRAGRRRGV